MSDRSAVLVLGMHRSGTSCLAGTLEEAGLHLGDVKRKSKFNAKGNRENFSVMRLNEQVLNDNDSAWHDPPFSPIKWTSDCKRKRDEILQSYTGRSPWGIKDPRLLFTLDGWLEVLSDPQLVGTFRNPISVARSLKKRNGFSISKGIDLWCAYNERLHQLAEQYTIPLIHFDVDEARYLSSAKEMINFLELTIPASGLTFFEDGLRHSENSRRASQPANKQSHALYERLLEHARAWSD